MFGAFQAIIFIWACRMGQNLKFNLIRFLIHTFKLKLHHLECLCRKPCLMFYAHALYDVGAHITLTTFTRFTQNTTIGSMLALYGSIMHVATL